MFKFQESKPNSLSQKHGKRNHLKFILNDFVHIVQNNSVFFVKQQLQASHIGIVYINQFITNVKNPFSILTTPKYADSIVQSELAMHKSN